MPWPAISLNWARGPRNWLDRAIVAVGTGLCHPAAMDRPELGISKRNKAVIAGVVLVIQLALFAFLIQVFSPGLANRAVEAVVSTFTVTVTTPPPSPSPSPEKAAKPAGAAAEAGKKAVPHEAKAPVPKLDLSPRPAPKAASTGSANSSGARDSGQGTGAGGTGTGTGSGNGGNGQGGGAVSRAVKIAGDINSARDYPAATRDVRAGGRVVVVVTVGIDGHARNCRVRNPGPDPEADRITCRLIEDRFRFRPATNAAGEPVSSTYGWEQRWWDPRR
jgi:periplasmic protein TonB